MGHRCLFTFLLGAALLPDIACAQDRPNVLILYADDLGYGDLGVQNPHSKIPTPNLDRLAQRGMRFTDGHSSSGICSPSRYALLTGRHHWRDFHGIVNAFGPSAFPSGRLTLAEMLQGVGYRTAAIGKWHLGWDWDAIRKPDVAPITVTQANGRKQQAFSPEAFDWSKPIPNGPLAHGFDYYFGDTVINFPPYCWIENDRVLEAPDTMMDTSKWKPIKEGNWECRPGPMRTGWDPYQVLPTLTAKGVQYIQNQADSQQPFFLYFAFPSPHAPIIPNDAFDGRSQAGPYGDFVCETDHCCGQLLEALESAGLADNTLVIFTADNGPEHYAYARDETYGHWSAHPLRGLKRDIYEGGHRVPLIIRWPGLTKPASVSSALVSQIDIMGTLASYLHAELPRNAAEDSHDLLPLLRGEMDAVRTVHVHNTFANRYAIRDGQWLLIDTQHGYGSARNRAWEARHGYPADDQGPVELYDLQGDLGQRQNVAGAHTQRVAAMQALLQQVRTGLFGAAAATAVICPNEENTISGSRRQESSPCFHSRAASRRWDWFPWRCWQLPALRPVAALQWLTNAKE